MQFKTFLWDKLKFTNAMQYDKCNGKNVIWQKQFNKLLVTNAIQQMQCHKQGMRKWVSSQTSYMGDWNFIRSYIWAQQIPTYNCQVLKNNLIPSYCKPCFPIQFHWINVYSCAEPVMQWVPGPRHDYKIQGQDSPHISWSVEQNHSWLKNTQCDNGI